MAYGAMVVSGELHVQAIAGGDTLGVILPPMTSWSELVRWLLGNMDFQQRILAGSLSLTAFCPVCLQGL